MDNRSGASDIFSSFVYCVVGLLAENCCVVHTVHLFRCCDSRHWRSQHWERTEPLDVVVVRPLFCNYNIVLNPLSTIVDIPTPRHEKARTEGVDDTDSPLCEGSG